MNESSGQKLNRTLCATVLASLLVLCGLHGGYAQERPPQPLVTTAKAKPQTQNEAQSSTRPITLGKPEGSTGKTVSSLVANGVAATSSTVQSNAVKARQNAQRRLENVARAQREVARADEGWVSPGIVGTGASERARKNPFILVLYVTLYLIIALITLYAGRHYWFTINRLVGKQRHPYIDIDAAPWPPVTVFIAAHNEEAVIDQIMDALLQVDYPEEKLRIIPVNDRSTDRTEEIIEQWVAHYPGRIQPFHRRGGAPGKAAALKDATELTQDDLILVFDADYVPGRGLVKQLVSPFFDPEVGAVMGRVVPWNVGSNLLARLLDLERSGGYQVDQQARMNMRLVPQYGGTVGGVRKSALTSVGGWREDSLSEDTDMTYKMLLAGWKTVYQNRSECYEEVPEKWDVRIRQIMRWTKGHNQAWARYSWPLLFNRNVSWRERLDGLLLLGVFIMSPVVLLGWILALLLFYMGESPYLGALTVLAVASYSALGNFAAFFEIAAAARLDGYRGRIRLLPLNALGFLVSLISTSRAGVQQITPSRRRSFQWDKTERFRNSPHHGEAPPLNMAPPAQASQVTSSSSSDTDDAASERDRVSL